jgi:hypothetical protein
MSTSAEIQQDYLADIAMKSAKLLRKQGIRPFLGASDSYHIEKIYPLNAEDLDLLRSIDGGTANVSRAETI